jgi:hypothetical protein
MNGFGRALSAVTNEGLEELAGETLRLRREESDFFTTSNATGWTRLLVGLERTGQIHAAATRRLDSSIETRESRLKTQAQAPDSGHDWARLLRNKLPSQTIFSPTVIPERIWT